MSIMAHVKHFKFQSDSINTDPANGVNVVAYERRRLRPGRVRTPDEVLSVWVARPSDRIGSSFDTAHNRKHREFIREGLTDREPDL